MEQDGQQNDSKKSDTPESPMYENPLESSSRWYLNARAQMIRYAASVGFGIANRTEPPAPEFSREVHLDSTLSPRFKGPKKIKVEVWVPERPAIGARPAVISFHGGGWILGQGTDNARWAGAIMNALDAVVFTVNYRLAPNYPFPTPLEDCIDSVCQIVKRAGEFNIDPEKIVISGFSAGATNTISTWICLKNPERFSYKIPSPPKIAGIVLFYPILDYTMSRAEKRQMCPRPDLTLPKGLTDLIDASYVYPAILREGRNDPRLSPGLMPDDLLEKLPPMHLCLCEYDMLLIEGMRFANRLTNHEKPFTLRVVEGEKHAWDNPPPMTPKASVAVEYGEAIKAMADWLGTGGDSTDKDSIKTVRKKRSMLLRPSGLLVRAVSSLEVRTMERKLSNQPSREQERMRT